MGRAWRCLFLILFLAYISLPIISRWTLLKLDSHELAAPISINWLNYAARIEAEELMNTPDEDTPDDPGPNSDCDPLIHGEI